jgi:hypothetical protein
MVLSVAWRVCTAPHAAHDVDMATAMNVNVNVNMNVNMDMNMNMNMNMNPPPTCRRRRACGWKQRSFVMISTTPSVTSPRTSSHSTPSECGMRLRMKFTALSSCTALSSSSEGEPTAATIWAGMGKLRMGKLRMGKLRMGKLRMGKLRMH